MTICAAWDTPSSWPAQVSRRFRWRAEHEGHIDLLITDVVMPEMSGQRVVGNAGKPAPRSEDNLHVRLHG